MWAAWLRHRRHGGDAELERSVLEQVAKVRDRVLDNARLAPGEALLDVGCGNGLIGFGALERGAGRVLFSDISDDLLDECRETAGAAGVLDRSAFVRAPADDLACVTDGSVDVVATRSVLIYVKDKQRAFGEFHRVLRAGGRISLFEPINRFGRCHRLADTFWGYDLGDLAPVRDKLNALYESIQPDDDPMVDFDERDLLALAEGTGFFPVELQYEAKVEPVEPMRWETFLDASGNPKIPTLAEAMEQVLAPAERERVAAHLQPLVEEGLGVRYSAVAYLSGGKR